MKILTKPICNVSHPYLYDNVEIKTFVPTTNQESCVCTSCIFCVCKTTYDLMRLFQTSISTNRETLQKVTLSLEHYEEW